MQNIQLSIITVSYKNIAGIKRTFESLRELLTNHSNSVEWLVIDAASDSETLEYLEQTSIHHPNFVFSFKKDKGIYDAMNKGVTLATGQYVWFLNAGDTLVKDSDWDKILDSLHSNYDSIFCSVYYDYGTYSYLRQPRHLSYAKYGMPANHQGILYNRKFLNEHPYPLKYGLSEDYWLSASLLKNNATFKLLHTPIARFEVGGVSTIKFMHVCRSMATIQKDVLSLNSLKIKFFYLRRITVMSINYIIFKFSRHTQ